MRDLIVVGSANLDLVATATRLPGPGETVLGSSFHEHAGGKGLNQAVAAARAGASVSFHGAVGDDEAGRRLRRLAAEAGVDVDGLAVVAEVPTGRALITVDGAAENSIVVVPGANGAARAARPFETRAVLAQLEIPVASVIEALGAARGVGALTVLNPAPGQELPTELLSVCDVVVPNEHELDLVGGVERLVAAGVRAVVVTRGAAGVSVHERREHGVVTWEQAPFPVTPVDTTGAGDAFCGAMSARLALGATLSAAVEFGAAAGALATTTPGAVASLPTRERIEALLASTSAGR